MIAFALIFLLFPTISIAIRRDLVYEACRRDPTLSFCDSHFLGKVTDNVLGLNKPIEIDEVFKDMKQWLEGYKDSTDDDDEEIEKSRRLHEDKNQYCHKYHHNYQVYCKSPKDGELDGVLPQFCSAFRVACDGIIPGVSREDGKFPEPQPLEKTFHVDENSVTNRPDKTTEYCKQFKTQYASLCFPASKQAVEFCGSFKDNCEKGGSSKDTSSTTTTPEPDIDDEGFLEEGPPEEETSPTTEGAGAQSESSAKVTGYCEKYSENYNYYCVGDTSGNNEKFCTSYRKNCPDKIGS